MDSNKNNSSIGEDIGKGDISDGEKSTSVIASDSYYTDVTVYSEQESPEERYYELFNKDKPASLAWSIISLVLGILAVALGFLGWVSLALGVAAIVFAVISRVKLKYFNGLSVAGLILGIFGIVFGFSVIAFGLIFGAQKG